MHVVSILSVKASCQSEYPFARARRVARRLPPPTDDDDHARETEHAHRVRRAHRRLSDGVTRLERQNRIGLAKGGIYPLDPKARCRGEGNHFFVIVLEHSPRLCAVPDSHASITPLDHILYARGCRGSAEIKGQLDQIVVL